MPADRNSLEKQEPEHNPWDIGDAPPKACPSNPGITFSHGIGREKQSERSE